MCSSTEYIGVIAEDLHFFFKYCYTDAATLVQVSGTVSTGILAGKRARTFHNYARGDSV